MYNNRGRDESDVTTAAMGCCCCVTIVGIIIVLASSFSSLHTTQYGLDYDHIFETVDKHVYTGGLHFLGIGNNFVKFPNTVQSVVYSQAMHDRLHARTSDGLPLILGVSFQYRLDVKQVHKLYMAFKDQHPTIVFNTGKHLIANAAANYSAYEFFNNKQGIAKDMFTYCNSYFQKHLMSYLDAFQINSVHLPDSFEGAIQDSLNMKQNITRTQKLVANVQVQLQTKVLVAHKNAESTIAKAEGDANAALARMSASANMTTQTVDAASKGLKAVKDKLGLKTMKTDTTAAHSEMLSYIYNDALSSPAMSNMQFLVGSAPGTYIDATKSSSSSSSSSSYRI